MYTTKLLRVNSKYRTPNSASCTDFTVNIPVRDLENVGRCCLVSAKIPRMFPNVYGSDTVLHCLVSENVGQPPYAFDVTVSAGLYTIETLTEELNRQLNSEFLFLTVVYNKDNNRFRVVLTNPPAAFSIEVLTTDLAQLIGVTSPITMFGSLTIYAQSPPALQGANSVYIESNFIANRSCLDVLENSLNIPLVNVIPCSTVAPGFDICYQIEHTDAWSIDYGAENTGLANLRSVDIRICDMYGNVLDIPPNCHVDLVFKIYKML